MSLSSILYSVEIIFDSLSSDDIIRRVSNQEKEEVLQILHH